MARAQDNQARTAGAVDGETTLKALLTEVHLLRIELQRANLYAFRAQTTIERIKMQQGKIDRIARELEDVQNELAGVEVAKPSLTQRVESIRDEIKDERNEERLNHYRADLEEAKGAFDQLSRRENQLQTRQGQLMTQLQTEQSDLDSLYRKLDALELEMQVSIEGKPNRQ